MTSLSGYKINTNWIVGLLLLIYLVNGIYCLQRQSITFDEGGHLNFGVRILKGNTERADDPELFNSKMPVSALNALPRAFEQLFHKGLKKTDWGRADILHGRYVTLLVSLLIGLYVFKWSSEWYGEKAGLFSLFLFVFCPNCLANAVLVTTDTYSVLLLLTVLYYLWKYASRGNPRDFLVFCFLTGIAQLVKQSLFHLYLIIPCLLTIRYLAGERRGIKAGPLLKKMGVFVVINLLVINAGFYFHGFGTSLSDYHFMSGLFQGLQRSLSFIHILPIALPVSFIEGLDMAKYYDQLGGGFLHSTFGNVTILGHSSNGGSFWYYYFVTCFYKTPIAVLCCLAWSLFLLVRRESFRGVARNELFLLLPVAYFFILMDFLYKTQAGVRQIIFIYPLLFVFCGILFRYIHARWEKRTLIFLSCVYLVSVLSYFGNYIPYTNEFIPDKKMAYRKVGAANLVFGQGLYFLGDYLRSHPGLTVAASMPRSGRQVISIDDFLDVWNEHHYDWISSFRPVGHIAHCYLIFDISPQDLANARRIDQ